MTTSPHTPAVDRLATLFPDPDAPANPTRWWQSRRRLAIGVAIALVASVVLASRAFGSSGPGYETAVVARRSVDATLTGTATVQPVSQATVAFPISGSVAAVNVKVGDTVTVGQSLASLDPTSLLEDLHSKQEQLAQAQLNLENALSGQPVTGAGGTGGMNTAGAGASGSSDGTSGAGSSSTGGSNATQRSLRSGRT